ncbi:hypothetical protein COH94_12660, partial [Neisseria meningitidis]
APPPCRPGGGGGGGGKKGEGLCWGGGAVGTRARPPGKAPPPCASLARQAAMAGLPAGKLAG